MFKLSKLAASGEVRIRAVATDLSGNVGEGVQRMYDLKANGPEKVDGVTAVPAMNGATLRWKDVEDEYFSYFVVEKKEQAGGAYKKVATVRDTLGAQVTGLQSNKEYWFRVSACDIFDNYGEYSDEIVVRTTNDTAKPAVSSIRPLPGYFSSTIPVTVVATDNDAVREAYVEASTDSENWARVATAPIASPKSSASVNVSVSVADMPEGPVFVRAFAIDASDNVSHPSAVVEHRIDRTPPAKPKGLSVVPASNNITVKWEKGLEDDLKSYSVYRSTSEDGTYSKFASGLTSLGYIDRSVVTGADYYYKVTATDAAGNESAFSHTTTASLIGDDEPPKIHSASPAGGARVGKNPLVRVLAQDNDTLARVHAEYQSADEWLEMGSVNASGNSFIADFTWNNKDIPTGNRVNVRFHAVDKAGNASGYHTAVYEVRNQLALKPELRAVPGDMRVDLSWDPVDDKDLLGYKLYRMEATGAKLLATFGPQNKLAYTDHYLDPSRTYLYYVETHDKYGNISILSNFFP